MKPRRAAAPSGVRALCLAVSRSLVDASGRRHGVRERVAASSPRAQAHLRRRLPLLMKHAHAMPDTMPDTMLITSSTSQVRCEPNRLPRARRPLEVRRGLGRSGGASSAHKRSSTEHTTQMAQMDDWPPITRRGWSRGRTRFGSAATLRHSRHESPRQACSWRAATHLACLRAKDHA